MTSPTTATIWTDEPRARRLGDALRRLGASVRCLAVGGPRSAGVEALANQLQVKREDDLRRLLIEYPSDYLLLAGDTGDAGAVVLATVLGSRPGTVLAVEPVAAGFDDLAIIEKHGGLTIVPAPAFTQAPGWVSAAEPFETLGALRSISYSAMTRPGDSSLLALLQDAWRVVLSLSELPEQIDASLAGPLPRVPEDLRGLTGHLLAHVRLPQRRSAVIHLCDLAGEAGRQLHVMGDAGQLRIGDLDYRLCDAAGRLIDHRDPPASAVDFAELLAAQWRALIERGPQAPGSQRRDPDPAWVLACCLTCLLSARTGQPESPGRLLEAHKV